MKKILVMLTLGVIVAGSSFAQTTPQKDNKARTENRGRANRAKDKKSPEERAELKTEKLSQRLALSAAQTGQLQALHLRQVTEREAMRAEARAQKGEAREAMKANHERHETELKEILTPQQFTKYQADREEMQSKRKNRSQEKGKGRKGK